MNHLFLHCRAGFEKECAAEISERAADAGVYGYCKTRDGSAWVVYVTQQEDGAEQLIRQLPFAELTFVRQWFASGAALESLPVNDRLTPLMAAAQALPQCRELLVETPDTNDGKELLTLGNKFRRPFEKALREQGRLKPLTGPWRLHLLFLSGDSAYLGVSPAYNAAPWAMGIPRLRLSRASPSRATLKLEEAWHHFIPADLWDERLAGGQKAVDLGAAPGGWTWLLVQRGMFVEAVDNGPMASELLETGQVVHRRNDGFLFEPKKRVQWLVCDIADKPARVADLVGRWMENRWFVEAIFNLKLPMKQRHAEVEKLRQRLLARADTAGLQVSLRFRQLYHDREEVTGHLWIQG